MTRLNPQVVRFERYRGPPRVGPRPKDKPKRKRRKDDADSDDSGMASAEERWQERKAEAEAWTDVVSRYVADVLPGRAHHLRYLYMFEQPERRADFARLLAAATSLRFLGLSLCRDSDPADLGVRCATEVRLTEQLAGCTSIEALQLGIDDSQGSWSGPRDSPRIAASIIDSLPNLQELVLLDIHGCATPPINLEGQAMLSAAVWRSSQLHTLTLNRSKLLTAPLPSTTRPPLTSLTLRATVGPAGGQWQTRPLETPPDALIEAFASTLEELVSSLQPSTAVLKSVAHAAVPTDVKSAALDELH